MGEIGYNREEFLYRLKFWEIKAIITGYRKRERTYCMLTRMQTFLLMLAGMADLEAAGIHNEEDLWTYPWEHGNIPDEKEVAEMTDMIRSLNIKNKNKGEGSE